MKLKLDQRSIAVLVQIRLPGYEIWGESISKKLKFLNLITKKTEIQEDPLVYMMCEYFLESPKWEGGLKKLNIIHLKD